MRIHAAGRRREWLDYIAPQIYWAEGFAPADYDVLVDWWATVLRESRSHTRLFIGQATYKIGTSTQSPEWIHDPHEMSNHLTFNQRYPQVDGDIFYNASSVVADLLGATSLVTQEHYQRPALVPTMPWLDHRPPSRVHRLHADRQDDTVSLHWHASRGDATDYAIYRIPAHRRHGRLTDGSHLVAVVPAGDSRTLHWTDPQSSHRRELYVVTAVDRLGNESGPALAR